VNDLPGQLEYKPDFADIARRWDAFWAGRSEGPLVAAVVPKRGTEPVERPAYGAGRDGDFGPVVDAVLRWAATHEFLGDAVPCFHAEFTADHAAVLMGAGLALPADGHGDGWSLPVLHDIRDADIQVRRDSAWYERTVRYLEALQAACEGRLFVAPPSFAGGLDTLAALRGSEALLVDLIEHPEAVHRALDQVDRCSAELLEEWARLLHWDSWGSVTRHGMYCGGRVSVPQCDFSCMIGEAMFREFELPRLEREIGRLDAAEYHLDGPGALRHLEAVCSLPRLDVVQWVPGSGPGELQDWSDLYRRIDGLGKGLIRWAGLDEVRASWRGSRSRKLFAVVPAEDDPGFRLALEETRWTAKDAPRGA
jgi:5-methyltetrahydrofolate--homocysteine methyltransferase